MAASENGDVKSEGYQMGACPLFFARIMHSESLRQDGTACTGDVAMNTGWERTCCNE